MWVSPSTLYRVLVSPGACSARPPAARNAAHLRGPWADWIEWRRHQSWIYDRSTHFALSRCRALSSPTPSLDVVRAVKWLATLVTAEVTAIPAGSQVVLTASPRRAWNCGQVVERPSQASLARRGDDSVEEPIGLGACQTTVAAGARVADHSDHLLAMCRDGVRASRRTRSCPTDPPRIQALDSRDVKTESAPRSTKIARSPTRCESELDIASTRLQLAAAWTPPTAT